MLSGSSVSSTVYAAFTKPAARSVRRRPRCGRRDAAGWPMPAPAGTPVRRSATERRVGHLPGIAHQLTEACGWERASARAFLYAASVMLLVRRIARAS